jgi:nitrate reductase assembly molybdenum cofactor insertion protein NarJ
MDDARQTQLLREATEWRLIGLLFECPTDGWREQIAALAAETADADLQAAARAAQLEAGEGLYHSIFGPGGPAPAREVSYRQWAQPGYLLSELAAYYDAFAYQPHTSEVPDHISVETGFVAYLRLKEAYARAKLDNAHAEITAEAACGFINEHLSHLAAPIAASLTASGVEYLSRTGAALLQRVGPARQQKPVLALPVLAADEEESFACGQL